MEVEVERACALRPVWLLQAEGEGEGGAGASPSPPVSSALEKRAARRSSPLARAPPPSRYLCG